MPYWNTGKSLKINLSRGDFNNHFYSSLPDLSYFSYLGLTK